MIWGIMLMLIGLVAALAVWQVPGLDSKISFYAVGGIIGGLYLIFASSRRKKK